MNIDALVAMVVGVEAIVLLGLIILVFGHAIWFQRHSKRAKHIHARARKIIMAALDDLPPSAEDMKFLTSMSNRLKIQLFTDLALIVGGDDRTVLRILAQEIGLVLESEKLCKSRFGSNRLFGARLLTMLNTGESVMPSLLHDKSPYVRTQAADWAGDHPYPEVISGVLDMLCDPNFSCKYAAKDALIRMDEAVVAYIVDYIDNGEECGIEGALEIAVHVADHRLLRGGIRYCGSESAAIRKLATTILGEIGGSDASSMVNQMLLDTEPIVRAEAARMAGKLGDWTAVTSLAKLLTDTDWNVRRNVCLSLASLGSPGLLMLRHNLKADDEGVLELAGQALALKEFSVRSASSIL